MSGDARAQLLATIEEAVTATLDRRLPGLAEDLAARVAAQLTPEIGADPELVDAAEIARRFGVSRDYIYEHAERLGAIRMGDGPKARLRFDPAKVAAALDSRPEVPEQAEATRPRTRRRASAPDLLPIRGEAAR